MKQTKKYMLFIFFSALFVGSCSVIKRNEKTVEKNDTIKHHQNKEHDNETNNIAESKNNNITHQAEKTKHNKQTQADTNIPSVQINEDSLYNKAIEHYYEYFIENIRIDTVPNIVSKVLPGVDMYIELDKYDMSKKLFLQYQGKRYQLLDIELLIEKVGNQNSVSITDKIKCFLTLDCYFRRIRSNQYLTNDFDIMYIKPVQKQFGVYPVIFNYEAKVNYNLPDSYKDFHGIQRTLEKEERMKETFYFHVKNNKLWEVEILKDGESSSTGGFRHY